MVLGWRRAFCTSIPRDEESNPSPSPKLSSRFGFFSNPSTPRGHRTTTPPAPSPNLRCRTTAVAAAATVAVVESPKLQCKTSKSHLSDSSSSPRSPSTFSLLKSSLRFSRVRCGICFHSIKPGQGTAIFTSECSHNFHSPCVATYATKQNPISCPTCGAIWTDFQIEEKKKQINQRPGLKVYNDDEPLASPRSVSRFCPIMEDDEEERDEEFEFCVERDREREGLVKQTALRNVEVMLMPEAAVVSVGRSYETYAVVLKVQAPPTTLQNSLRVPIDLVAVLDVSSNLSSERVQTMKRAIRLVISSLTSTDRLSIVAFGAVSKRLLPLRRMSASGKLSARRLADSLVSTAGKSSAADALKKAAKVVEDRRHRNPAAAILLLSDSPSPLPLLDAIPIHTLSLDQACSPDALCLLRFAVLDLRIELGLVTGSGRAEIAAVYPVSTRFGVVGRPGSIRVGDLYSGEEREYLIELRVPTSLRSHHVLSVRLGHRELSSEHFSFGKDQGLLVPRPHTVRSPAIERLRCLFLSTRAVAESRRLLERGDVNGAAQLLTSTRAVLMRSKSDEAGRYLTTLETELSELRKVKAVNALLPGGGVEDKCEQMTPTSAWRAAERLAKVAIMRKSLNRVSDLHGFEDARF